MTERTAMAEEDLQQLAEWSSRKLGGCAPPSRRCTERSTITLTAEVVNTKAYGRMPAVAIGRCIYCGTTEGPLTREHVVPKGLGGHLVLHDASCTPCQQLIGQIETAVLRDSLRAFRAKLKYPSQSKGSRPTRVQLETGSPDSPAVLDVAIEAAPAILILPIFAEPRVTSGRTGADGAIDGYGHHVVVIDQDAAAQVMREHQVSELRVRMKTYEYEFARLLAKIAWGHAVWEFGLDAFAEVFVLPALLGQTQDMGKWVGCPPRRLGEELEAAVPPQSFYIHRAISPTGIVMYSLRLLADVDPETPQYVVVVGRLHAASVPSANDRVDSGNNGPGVASR